MSIIVSGGDIGAQTSPQALVDLVDSALVKHKIPQSVPAARADNSAPSADHAKMIGPPVSSTGARCLADALGDAGPYAGALLYVADLSWQSDASFLYVTRYTPPLVPRRTSGEQSTTSTTLPKDRPTLVMLIVADSDCHLETATLFA